MIMVSSCNCFQPSGPKIVIVPVFISKYAPPLLINSEISYLFWWNGCLVVLLYSLVSSYAVLPIVGRVLSCEVLWSCLVESCLVWSFVVLSCVVLRFLMVLFCIVLSCINLSCLVWSCLVLWFCLVVVLCCLVMILWQSPCIILSCLVVSLVLSFVLSRVLSMHRDM